MKGILLKLQFSLRGVFANDLRRFLLPTAARGIETVKNLNLSAFSEGFIEGSALVYFRRTDEQLHVVTETGGKNIVEFFQRLLHRSRAPHDRVREEIHILEPDQLGSSKKWDRLQGFDRRSDASRGLFRVVRATIDYFQTELARLGRSQLSG